MTPQQACQRYASYWKKTEEKMTLLEQKTGVNPKNASIEEFMSAIEKSNLAFPMLSLEKPLIPQTPVISYSRHKDVVFEEYANENGDLVIDEFDKKTGEKICSARFYEDSSFNLSYFKNGKNYLQSYYVCEKEKKHYKYKLAIESRFDLLDREHCKCSSGAGYVQNKNGGPFEIHHIRYRHLPGYLEMQQRKDKNTIIFSVVDLEENRVILTGKMKNHELYGIVRHQKDGQQETIMEFKNGFVGNIKEQEPDIKAECSNLVIATLVKHHDDLKKITQGRYNELTRYRD